MPYSLALPGELTTDYSRREPLILSKSIFRMAKAAAELATLAAVTVGTVIFFTGLNLVMVL